MNQQQFNKLYNTAIQKVAVGFFILDNCGERLGFDIEMIDTNKQMLCEVLSEDVSVPATTIYSDANSIRLEHGYITQLRHSGLLEELISTMQVLTSDERQKLNYI
jgi:hypothetical protein